MNKVQLVEALATELNITKTDALNVYETISAIIVDTLANGENVKTPFGSLKLVKRSARVARNPKTGKPVKVAAKTVVKFKAAKALAEALRK